VATNVWKGGAALIAQVDKLTPGGTIEATDIFTVTIGGKSISVVAGGTTVKDVVVAMTAAWNASTEAEFAEITAANVGDAYISLTSDTPGVPFTVTATTTETNGDPADAQTFVRSAYTANSGPNDAAVNSNWSTNDVPGGDAVVFEDSSVSCLYNLDQLGTVAGTPILTSLTVKSTYTGYIGLPRNNPNGYVEYRPTALALGTACLTIDIGEGDGAGSSRINLAVGICASNLTMTVNKTGSRLTTGVPALLLTTGTQANDTTLTVNRGDVGVAFYAGETAVIDAIKMVYVSQENADAKVACGSGVTLTTVNVGGGAFVSNANVVTLTQTKGTAELRGTATMTTGTISGGTLYYNSSGTCTTMYVAGGATLDFRKDGRSRTLTNATIYQGGAIYDSSATVTWTNGIIVAYCGLADVKIDVGEGRTIMKP
jgi:hypothetical protein